MNTGLRVFNRIFSFGLFLLSFFSVLESKAQTTCSVDAGNDTIICQNQRLVRTATVTPASGATIQWYLQGNSSNILSTTAAINSILTTSGTFNYIIRVTTGSGNNACIETDTIQVTVNPSPRVNAGSTRTVCQGSTLNLSATVSPTLPAANINWYQVGSTTSLATGTTYSNVPTNTAGTVNYYVKADSASTCSTNDTVSVVVNPKPVANFTFTSNCGRNYNFTSTSTTAGGTITDYCWNFGTGSGCQSTSANPNIRFPRGSTGNTYTIRLIVTNSFGCRDTVTQNVTVGSSPLAQLANASASQQTTTINGEQYFFICSSGSQQLQFLNNSQNYTSATTYQIHWGDASLPQNYDQTTFPAPITAGVTIGHNYSVGTYTLTFIMNNGSCIDSVKYKVFVGSVPGAQFGSGITDVICSGNQDTVQISGTSANTSGTLYTVTFNDGSNDSVVLTHPISNPYSIIHTFPTTSCGTNTPNGTSTSFNAFGAFLTVKNPCGTKRFSVSPIYVAKSPEADFTITPHDSICIGQTITLTNIGDPGKSINVSNETCTDGKIVWQITPVSPGIRYQIQTGSNLGSVIQGGVDNWVSGTNTVNVRFDSAGIYTIRLLASNSSLCSGTDTMIKTICVNPIPTASYTLTPNIGCVPLRVIAAGSTNTPTCGQNTFNWTVSYTPAPGCTPNISDYGYVNGTSATSQNPQFSFNSPGVYTIGLQTFAPNARCSSAVVTQQVTVKSKPRISFSLPTDSICPGGSITPTLSSQCYITAADSIYYTWAFSVPGVTPNPTNTSIPPTITYNPPNTDILNAYTISIAVGNSCGVTRDSSVLFVKPIPRIPGRKDSICSPNAFTYAPVTTPASPPYTVFAPVGTSYSWGMPSGTVSSGAASGFNQPNFNTGTLTNNTDTIQTLIYTITPSYKNCQGPSFKDTVVIKPKPNIQNITLTICSKDSFHIVPVTGGGNIVPAGTTYTWTAPSSTIITGQTTQNSPLPYISQTLVNTTNTSQQLVYTVTPNYKGCPGQPFTITVTVDPRPKILNQSTAICDSATFTVTPQNNTPANSGVIVPANTTYTWTVNSSLSVNGELPQTTPVSTISQLLVNNTNTTQTVVYTVTPKSGNCVGDTFLVTVTLNPRPVVPNSVINICSGGNFNATPVNNPPSVILPTGTTYTWTVSSNPSVSGQANQTTPVTNIRDTLVNNSNVQQTVIYTITPKSGVSDSCVGRPFTVTVTIDPIVRILDTTRSICSGTAFSVSPSNAPPSQVVPAGTTYTWTAPTNALGATSQSTSQTSISQTLTNNTNVKDSVTYTVIASGGCGLDTFSVKVVVSPKPKLLDTVRTICSGSSFTVTPANAAPNQIVPSGTTYTWTAPTNALGATSQSTGLSSISQTLTNNTNVRDSVAYTVIAIGNAPGCGSDTFTIKVIVNPKPKVRDTTLAICSGESFTLTPVNGQPNQIIPDGTTYTWTAPTNALGATSQSTSQTSISQTLTNNTNVKDSVTYTVIASGGCGLDTFSVKVVVSPKPKLLDTVRTICSGSSFTVTPANAAPNQIVPSGTTYTWTVPTNALGATSQSTGLSSISQTLTNNTNVKDSITYTVIAAGNGIGCGADTFSVKVIVNPKPKVRDTTLAICSGESFTLTPVNGQPNQIIPAGTTYTWTAPTNALGATSQSTSQTSISQTLTNNTNVKDSVTYTVIASGGCGLDTFSVKVVVSPKPKLLDTVRTICSGSSFTVTPANTAPNQIVPSGTTYTWTVGLQQIGLTGGSSGAGSSVSGGLFNSTDSVRTIVYNVIAIGSGVGCGSDTFQITVNVNPAPRVTFNPAGPQTICSGDTTRTVTITSPTPGASVPWNSMSPLPSGLDTSVLITSGTNTIPSQTLINLTNQPITLVDSAQAVTGGSFACPGTKSPYQFIVNPKPKVRDTTLAICSGGGFTLTPVNGQPNQIIPAGTTYTWTVNPNNNITGESGQTTPQSSISDTLVNESNVLDSVLYTVIAIGNAPGCGRDTFTVKVVVNPKPKVRDTILAICSGDAFTLTPVNGQPSQIIPAGTTYTWTVNGNNNIIGESGQSTAQLSVSDTLVNETNVRDSVLYTVIATGTGIGCGTDTFSVKVIVNPKPKVRDTTLAICSGNSFSLTPVNGQPNQIIPAGTTYTWTVGSVGAITGASNQSSPQLSISDTLVNESNVRDSVLYTVIALSSAPACGRDTFTVKVVVNPKPKVRDTTLTICSGSTFTLTPSNNQPGQIVPAGTTYSWTSGSGGSSGSGTSISGSLSNSTDSVRTIVYTVIATGNGVGCGSDTFLLTVNVNPSPRVTFNPAGPQTICSGDTTRTVTITSPTPGASVPWSSMSPLPSGLDTSVLITSGTNTIPSQTLINLTNQPITLIDSAQAVTSGQAACPGVKTAYEFIVNPKPKVRDTTLAICSGGGFTLTPVNGQPNQIIPAGTTYIWTVGSVGAITGASNQTIAQSSISDTLVNESNVRDSVLYTVIAIGNAPGCGRDTFTVKVVVNPKPKVRDTILAICSGDAFTLTPVNGQPAQIIPAGTTYTWTAPTNVLGATSQSTGLSSIGQTLTNNTNVRDSVLYTVIATGTGIGCGTDTFSVKVIVNPKPKVRDTTLAICSGNSFALTPVNGQPNQIIPAGTTYTWTVGSVGAITGASNQSTPQLSISDTLVNETNVRDSVLYTVIALSSAPACGSDTFNVKVYVNPKPKIQDSVKTICSGSTFTVTPTNQQPSQIVPVGTTYEWSILSVEPGLANGANGTGSSITGTLTNSTDSVRTIVYTVIAIGNAPGCGRDTFLLTVNVNPAPRAIFTPLSPQSICSGDSSPVITITSPTPGALLPWSTTIPIGINPVTITQDTGIIPSQVFVNQTSDSIHVHFSVTPQTTGALACPGIPSVFTLIVNPTPKMPDYTRVICSRDTFHVCPQNNPPNTIVPGGTTYTWFVTVPPNAPITGASNQSVPQSCIEQALTNNGNTPVNVVYHVTPRSGVLDSCTGLQFTVTVTVNPAPVFPTMHDTICSGTSFDTIPQNNPPSFIVPNGTTYTWGVPVMPQGPGPNTVSGTSGGDSSNGSQTQIFGTLVNTAYNPLNVTYSVIPTSPNTTGAACAGAPFNYIVTVNPLPVINNNPLSQAICNEAFTQPVLFTSFTNNTSYQWQTVSTGTVTGQLASGTGDIPSMQLFNTGIAQDSLIYSVTTTANGCAGPPILYTIYVNPDAKAEYSYLDDTACWPFALPITNVSPTTADSAYYWYADGVLIGTGYTFPGYTLPGPSQSVEIKLVTISRYGCDPDSISHTFYTKPMPDADFSMSNRDSCGPLTVQFTNLTNLTDTFQYQWDFGINSQTSTAINPAPVTYLPSPQFIDITYYITLTAFNECATDTKTDSVIVRASPKALFAVDTTFGCSPLTVTISNTSLGNPHTFEWYWDTINGVGDTTTSDTTFTHTYVTTVVDTFYLTLISINDCGRDTMVIPIRVAPNTITPGVSVNAPELFGCAPHTVNFNNASSGATSFTWIFGDGDTAITGPFQFVVPHTYLNPGVYNVQVNMTNGCSNATDFETITVLPNPIADFSTTQPQYCLGVTTQVVNNSTNANNYIWNWGVNNATSSGFNPTFTYPAPGVYNITLTAQQTAPTGTVCFDTAIRQVIILNKPDSTIITNLGQPNCAPFNLTASAPGIQLNETVTWSIYQGASNPTLIHTDTGTSLLYTIPSEGTYTLQMIAENAQGCKDSTTRQFYLYQKPIAGITPTAIATCSLDTVITHFNTSTANAYTPMTYRWFIDGNFRTTGLNLTARYLTPAAAPLPRVYDVSLVAINSVGCTDTARATVQVNPTSDARFVVRNPNACIPFVADIANLSVYATQYAWYLDGTLVSTDAVPQIPITAANTSYTIRLITSNGFSCRPDTAEFTFRTRVMPIAAFTVPDTLSCTGRLTLLPVNQSQHANLFTWNWGDGTPQNSTTAYVPFAHTYTNVGQYVLSLVASDRTCADTATRIIVVANKPVADFVASETETCDTAIIRLQNITSNANSFLWSVNNGLYTSTAISPIFNLPPSNAPYTIQLIAANSAGCKDTIVKANYIRAIPLPPADFYINPAPVITVPNYSFSYTNLTPNSPLYQYSWSLGDNTYANTRDVLNHLYPDTGSYTVQLVVLDTSTNCQDTVVKIVKIVGQPGYLYVPNAFYPNSIDVQFRSFKPLGKGLAEYELQIFDNWGKLLFQTNRLDAAGSPVEGWDGTYKGMPMAQDAYAWRIRAKYRNGRYWEGMQYNQQQYGSPGHTFGTVTLFR